MNQDAPGPAILLVEANADFRELEEIILRDAGFQVTLLPPTEDPIRFAARTTPRAIVIHLGHDQPYQAEIVDRFQTAPSTQTIPIVAIALSEPAAARAQAGANVSQSVVAPYDIAALEAAVALAVGHPPPAAALPQPPGSVSPAVAFAGGSWWSTRGRSF